VQALWSMHVQYNDDPYHTHTIICNNIDKDNGIVNDK